MISLTLPLDTISSGVNIHQGKLGVKEQLEKSTKIFLNQTPNYLTLLQVI